MFLWLWTLRHINTIFGQSQFTVFHIQVRTGAYIIICTHIHVRTNIFHYWLLFLNQAPSLPVYRFKRLKCTILHKALGPFCILKVRSESLETILKGPSQRSWSFFERPFGRLNLPRNAYVKPTLMIHQRMSSVNRHRLQQLRAF